jgi:RhtB (resistance to homoserine/threonine) family protein
MNFWQGFTIVTCVHLLAAASPGPDFALVTRQSLLHGRKAGVLTSLGISLGLAIHIFYSAAGLAVVVAHSVEGMVVVKLAGGSYLTYLGIKGLGARHLSADDNQEIQQATNNSASRMISTGFFCNALNPKAPVYFLSLFTVILSPEIPLPNLAIYGVWIMVLQMLWFTTLACFFTNTAIRHRVVKLGHWVDRTFGVVMLALGLQVLNSIR